MERERERARQHSVNETNQPKVKKLYSYIPYVIAYFTHTLYTFLPISIRVDDAQDQIENFHKK